MRRRGGEGSIVGGREREGKGGVEVGAITGGRGVIVERKRKRRWFKLWMIMEN